MRRSNTYRSGSRRGQHNERPTEHEYQYEERISDYERKGGKNRQPQGDRVKVQRSSANKSRDKNRDESFRFKKSTEITEAYHAELRKNLLSGFDGIEDVVKAKEYELRQRDIPIPVSTRTAGFASQEVFTRVAEVPDNINRMNDMTVHQLYRVQLAAIEYRVSENRRNTILPNPQAWYNFEQFEAFRTTASTITTLLQRTGCLVKSIPKFRFEDQNYVPLFPAQKYDLQNRAVPAPECVYLTNLRSVVEYLGNNATEAEVRANFRLKNPIPRSTWNVGNVLQNIDDIIPAEYGPQQLLNDCITVKSWIEQVITGKLVREKWFTSVQLYQPATGNESIFVSNNSCNLRCQELPNLRLEGDVSTFWTRPKLDSRMLFYGVYGLSGEITSVNRYLWPNYCIRDQEQAGYDSHMSYREIGLLVE